MTDDLAKSALRRALELSRELADAADRGDAQATVQLDAQRLELLRAARGGGVGTDEDARAMLCEITALNAKAIGSLLHRQRAVARDLDMLAMGKRAIRAYAAVGLRR